MYKYFSIIKVIFKNSLRTQNAVEFYYWRLVFFIRKCDWCNRLVWVIIRYILLYWPILYIYIYIYIYIYYIYIILYYIYIIYIYIYIYIYILYYIYYIYIYIYIYIILYIYIYIYYIYIYILYISCCTDLYYLGFIWIRSLQYSLRSSRATI